MIKRRAVVEHMESMTPTFRAPSSFQELRNDYTTFSGAIKVIAGNTGEGPLPTKTTLTPAPLVTLRAIPEMGMITISQARDSVTFGGAVTLEMIADWLQDQVALSPATFPALIRHFELIANTPVRSMGSWAGNLMLTANAPGGGFQSDVATIFWGAGATLSYMDMATGGTGTMSFDTFFAPGSFPKPASLLLTGLTLPFATSSSIVFRTYKAMERHVNSHALVNAALYAQVSSSSSQGSLLSSVRLVYGGMGSMPVSASKTAQALQNGTLDATLLSSILSTTLPGEVVPDPVQGNVAYRRAVAGSFTFKFLTACLPSAHIPSGLEPAITPFVRPPSTSSFTYKADASEAPLSYAIPKLSALLQTSGEAQYVSDLPKPASTLYGAFVTASVGTGHLVSVTPGEAEEYPGYVGLVTARDMTNMGGENVFSASNEPVFVEEGGEVMFHGQAVAMVLAESQAAADAAAELVTASYDTSQAPPVVTTIEEAVEKGMYFTTSKILPVSQGDIASALSSAQHVVSGTASLPSQAHFYLEQQTSYATPGEGGKISLVSATQWPSLMRTFVAKALGKPAAHVDVAVTRLGGAYGGKIDRCVQVGVAVAAAAEMYRVPVESQLTLKTNFALMGKRRGYSASYKVGFNDDGTITGIQAELVIDAGAYNNCVAGTNAVEVFYWFDNVLKVGAWDCSAQIVQTNTPPTTSARAPGALPALYFIETIVDQVATATGLSPTAVRAKNMYAVGDVTPYGQPLPYFNIPKILSQLESRYGVAEREAAVKAFNASSTFVKRGLAVIPQKYGIEWVGANYHVLVSIVAADGTVQVTHAGIEMGQGIDVKVAQTVAYELGLGLDAITITPTSTSVVANAAATGGSIGSGLNAAAAVRAAQELRTRLAPIAATLGVTLPGPGSCAPISGTWLHVVGAAASAGVSLAAEGFQDLAKAKTPFVYNSYCGAVAEVEVDLLSGQTQVLSVNMVFDCGISLNPAVDIGQAVGGFTMGMGYFTSEQVLYDAHTGANVTNTTWTYKPPSALDIPLEFTVDLLKDAPNPLGVLSSKASGEPPLCMATSVYFAIKAAVSAYKGGEWVDLPVPATPMAVVGAAGVGVSDLVGSWSGSE